MSAYLNEQIRRKSKAARERVAKRWQMDKVRRDHLARVEAADPLRMPSRILRRVIVVDSVANTVHEIIRYATDSERSWKRKLEKHRLTITRRVL